MKLLLLTYEYPPFNGGVAAYLSNLMKTAPTGTEFIIEVPKAGEHWIMTLCRQFFMVRKIKPDLVAVSHVLPAGYVAYKINLWCKTPYLVFTHGTDILTARRSAWKRFWMRYILRHAKYVIANSRFTAALLHEEGITKVEIVPPGLANGTWQMANGADSNNTIISIGRLIPRKGFDTLIKAMPAIIKDVPDANLRIIGRGAYYDELIRLAHELHVERFVEILTDVDDAKKRQYLASSALFALAARKVGDDIEGFGIVTLEASAAGLPVVVTSSGGSAEPVVDNVTGVIAPADDLATLSAIIIKLLKDKNEAEKLGAAGREYVGKEYSIDVIGKRFWKLIS
jgi:phosphatidylinositol alpha-1,6-mannosyltransferase